LSSSPARSRRDFLLLRVDGQSTVLSCEALFMRVIDAENSGTIDRLFDNLARDLAQVRAVTVVERSWLARDDLRARVDALLDTFRAGGGRVES
jgi:hypothetical protein